jgi:hypothetical protein
VGAVPQAHNNSGSRSSVAAASKYSLPLPRTAPCPRGSGDGGLEASRRSINAGSPTLRRPRWQSAHGVRPGVGLLWYFVLETAEVSAIHGPSPHSRLRGDRHGVLSRELHMQPIGPEAIPRVAVGDQGCWKDASGVALRPAERGSDWCPGVHGVTCRWLRLFRAAQFDQGPSPSAS